MIADAYTIELGPGIVGLLAPIAAALAAWLGTRNSRKEMKPNGGSSMRDAVDRIEKGVASLHTRVNALEQAATSTTVVQPAIVEVVPTMPSAVVAPAISRNPDGSSTTG